jgi:hypothetical protein
MIRKGKKSVSEAYEVGFSGFGIYLCQVVYTTPRGPPGSALAPHCLYQTSYPL